MDVLFVICNTVQKKGVETTASFHLPLEAGLEQ